MRIEDVMKLINAGFNKSEILVIAGAEATPPEPAQAAPEQDPQQTAAPAAPEQDPQQTAAPAAQPEQNAAIEQLTQQVANLTALVQKSNLFRMEQPAAAPDSAEDVIASIIYPTYAGDNK